MNQHNTSVSRPNVVQTANNVSTRYIGLVTIGGEYIRRIEIEEFDPSGIA